MRSNLHWGQTASRKPATMAQEKEKRPSSERQKKRIGSLRRVHGPFIARQDIAISDGREGG